MTTTTPDTETKLRIRRPSPEQAFRAVIEERLANLDEQVREVKTRVNGLLFFIAGTAAAQLLLGVLS